MLPYIIAQTIRVLFRTVPSLALIGAALCFAGTSDAPRVDAVADAADRTVRVDRADIGVVTVAEHGQAATPASGAASSGPACERSERVNLSARINDAVDNVLALAFRLLELPLFVVLLLVAAALVIPLVFVARALRGRASRRLLLPICFGLLAAIGFVVMEWRLTLMDRRIRELQNRVVEQQGGMQAMRDARGSGPRHLFFDREVAEKGLRAAFGDVRVMPTVQGEAMDMVFIRLAKGPVHAFLAVVDLTYTNLGIRLDSAIGKKTLTSEFARSNGCAIAINGEAGNSPALDASLGDWVGNFVSAGNPIMLKDSDKRPFLAFDRRNKASYSPARVVAKTASPDWHNVIWGRHDVLADGKPAEAAQVDCQPRTAMAIDGRGALLYLLVVDGRQSGYSVGLTRKDVGLLLSAFGARDGMLCDEGGSSCMYTAQAGGVVNTPSDSGGKERPTYTHFGVAMGAGGR